MSRWHSLHGLASVFLAGAWLGNALAAQCQDPPVPASGFATAERLDTVVTFADGAKTMIDVTYPSDPSGACGWPVLVLVHGLGGTRKDLVWARTNCATLGYIVASYDVRGHGDAQRLSHPSFGCGLIGKEERLDLAEIINWVGAVYGTSPKADMNRVGVAGPSQGGLHAWAAAAWSGKPLPPNSRSLATFPKVKLASPGLFSAMHQDVFAPGGTMVMNNLVVALWRGFGVRWDTAFAMPMVAWITSENYGAIAAYFANDPWRQDRAQLATSDVATYVSVGWNDSWVDVQSTLDALSALPAATPRLAHLDSSVGHGVLPNYRQYEMQQLTAERWVARFLKGADNGVEREAVFHSSLVNADPAYDLDTGAPLWNRKYDSWPPADNVAVRVYLREQQSLSPSGPVAAEPADGPVVNAVATGYGMAAYAMQSDRPGATIFANVPLSSLSWDSDALPYDVELAGQARVTLEVTTSDTTLLVHCALFDVPPSAPERYLTSGVVAVRGAVVPPSRLVVDMSPVQVRFPQGHRMRLRVENAPWRRTTTQDEMIVPPCFAPFRLVIEHGVARPSTLDLPMRPAVMPALGLADYMKVAIDKPQDVSYRLQAPAAWAGHFFAVFWSASGTASVMPWPGSDPVRLTIDPLTIALAGGTPFADWVGTLSPSAVATPVLKLSMVGPLPAALAGTRISCVALVGPTALQLSAVTGPVDLVLR